MSRGAVKTSANPTNVPDEYTKVEGRKPGYPKSKGAKWEFPRCVEHVQAQASIVPKGEDGHFEDPASHPVGAI